MRQGQKLRLENDGRWLKWRIPSMAYFYATLRSLKVLERLCITLCLNKYRAFSSKKQAKYSHCNIRSTGPLAWNVCRLLMEKITTHNRSWYNATLCLRGRHSQGGNMCFGSRCPHQAMPHTQQLHSYGIVARVSSTKNGKEVLPRHLAYDMVLTDGVLLSVLSWSHCYVV